MANHTMESFKEHRLVNQAAKPFGYKDHWLKHVAFPFDVTDMRLLSWLQDISWVDAYMAPVLVLTEDEEELKKLYFIRDEVKGFISEKISLGK